MERESNYSSVLARYIFKKTKTVLIKFYPTFERKERMIDGTSMLVEQLITQPISHGR